MLGHRLSELTGIQLYFKKEFMHRTGSFKERGARNALKMLSPQQKKTGVIAASAGNHALGLAYHGQLLGIPVYLVMPVGSPHASPHRTPIHTHGGRATLCVRAKGLCPAHQGGDLPIVRRERGP